MTPSNADLAHARGTAMRQARATRTRAIRRRVVAGAVSLFLAIWLLIAVVLVSGHDPALAARKVASTTTTNQSANSTGASGSGSTKITTTASGKVVSSGSATTSGTTTSGTTSSGSTSGSGPTSGLTTRES